jgi:hypothetical protein
MPVLSSRRASVSNKIDPGKGTFPQIRKSDPLPWNVQKHVPLIPLQSVHFYCNAICNLILTQIYSIQFTNQEHSISSRDI